MLGTYSYLLGVLFGVTRSCSQLRTALAYIYIYIYCFFLFFWEGGGGGRKGGKARKGACFELF